MDAKPTQNASPQIPRLVTVPRIRELDPSWPFSTQSTYRLIAKGHLGCKRAGRKILLTAEHLADFAKSDAR
jgi:hypothetical protein